MSLGEGYDWGFALVTNRVFHQKLLAGMEIQIRRGDFMLKLRGENLVDVSTK